MYVFIDESGDAGYKFSRGSSRYFVVACLVFSSADAVDQLRQTLQNLKRELGWRQESEFKHSKMRVDLVHKVLEVVDFAEIVVQIFYFDKAARQNVGLSHLEMVGMAITNLQVVLRAAVVKVDGASGSSHRGLVTSLKSNVVKGHASRAIRSIRMVRSESEVLIQLADLVAGITRKSLDLKEGQEQKYRVLLKKVLCASESKLIPLA